MPNDDFYRDEILGPTWVAPLTADILRDDSISTSRKQELLGMIGYKREHIAQLTDEPVLW